MSGLPDIPQVPTPAGPPAIPPELLRESVIRMRGPQDRRPKPIWPSILIGLLVTPIAAIVQSLVISALLAITDGTGIFSDMTKFEEAMVRPPNLFLAILTLQLSMAGTVILAAWIGSRHGDGSIHERLGLRRTGIGTGRMLLLVLASIGVYCIGTLPSTWLMKMGVLPGLPEHYVKVFGQLSSAPLGWRIALLLAMSLGPGFCEEIAFRGYVQTRLQDRWRPIWAVGFSSTLFALSHMNITHIASILVIAFWLGYVRLRIGSTVPGMVCHFAINFSMFSMMVVGFSEDDPAVAWIMYGLGGLGVLAAVPTVLWLRRRARDGVRNAVADASVDALSSAT